MDNKEKLSRKEKKALKKAQKAEKAKMPAADKKGIALVAVLAVIAACLLFNFVSLMTEKPYEDVDAPQTSTTATTTATTQPPASDTTTQPSVPQQDTTTDNDNQQDTTAPDETEPQKDEKQEILDVISDSINLLKSDKASFIGHKTQILDMELTECSAPGFVGVINTIMNMFIETEIYDFDFTNGKGYDPENKTDTTTMETFPPVNKAFALTIDGIAEATKEQQGENTVYKVKLVPEKSTKENPKTKHHETACDTLDLSTFNMPIGEITRADLEYPGAVVGVTLDKDGKVVGYYERLDIIGTGEAAAWGMSGGGTVEGFIDETWVIEWK